MHPNPLFHSDDRAMIEAMIAQVGVGTVFGQTRTGPCAARTPLIVHGAGQVQYHLAKSNPLVDGLDGGSALVTDSTAALTRARSILKKTRRLC